MEYTYKTLHTTKQDYNIFTKNEIRETILT